MKKYLIPAAIVLLCLLGCLSGSLGLCSVLVILTILGILGYLTLVAFEVKRPEKSPKLKGLKRKRARAKSKPNEKK
jgi:hypothetical protein